MTDALSIIASVATIVGVIVAIVYARRQDKSLMSQVERGRSRQPRAAQEKEPLTAKQLEHRAKSLVLRLTALRYLAGLLLALSYVFYWFRSAPMPSGQEYYADTLSTNGMLSAFFAIVIAILIFLMLFLVFRTERGWWFPSLIIFLAVIAWLLALVEFDRDQDDAFLDRLGPATLLSAMHE